MSVDLNNYFKLGLDSTNQATQQAGLINTIRTPADTTSAALNRVTFKVPKTGMLTADSHFNIRFTSTGTGHNVNLISGALGAVKRMRITMGNKVLTDIERPSLHIIPHLYSRNTLTQLSDYHKHFIGCNYLLDTQFNDGTNTLNPYGSVGFTNAGALYQRQGEIGSAGSPTYSLPLRLLGADFLNAASMPVFLLQNQEMIIELEFSADARDYVFIAGGAASAASTSVDLNNIELVSTHIMLPDEVEQQQIQSLRTQPAQYPLIDTYLIRGVLPAGTGGQIGTPATVVRNELYRLNVQNREVHKMLCVFKPLDGTSNTVFANQRSLACGDENIQLKINGLNYFERPLTNSAIIYQVFKDYLDGMGLKFPVESCNGGSFVSQDQVVSTQFLQALKQQHYVGFDFKNGNQGVFGAGTIMKNAIELEYESLSDDSRVTESGARDMFFYVSVSKMLSIGNNVVSVSF